MTQYRVGPDGALVLDEQQRVVARLRPGLVVVPAPSSAVGSPTTEERIAQRRSYDDKVVRPEHGPTS